MPVYVYACMIDREHPRKEISAMISQLDQLDEEGVFCDECNGLMNRIPQPFDFGFSPGEVLTEWMDDNLRKYRSGQPIENKYKIIRPDKPIPGKDFRTRR